MARYARTSAVLLTTVLALAGVAASAPGAASAAVTVSDTAGLIAAIDDANAGSGQPTIRISGNLGVTGPLPQITSPVRIEGESIDFNGWPGFDAASSAVEIRGLQISGATGPSIRIIGDDAVLEHVFVFGTGSVGTSIVGGSARLSDVRFFGVDRAFDIELTSGTSTIEHVEVNGPPAVGDALLSASGDAVVTLKHVWANLMSGPLVIEGSDDAAVTVADITVTQASGDGAILRTTSTHPMVLAGFDSSAGPATALGLTASEGGTIAASGIEVRTTPTTGTVGLAVEADGGTVAVDGLSTDGVEVGVSATIDDGSVVISSGQIIFSTGAGIDAVVGGPDGALVVDQSTISAATVGVLARVGPGGSSVVVSRSTVNDTQTAVQADLEGAGSIDLVNSTISGNGSGPASGLRLDGPPTASARIVLSTLARNWGTSTIGAFGPALSIESSIVADNSVSAEDVAGFGSEVTIDHSLIGQIISPDVRAAFESGDGNLGGDPQLGQLADNGGPTLTLLPAATSPVIDAGGSPADPPATDQRLDARVVSRTVDMGAVEVGRVLAATGTTAGWELAGIAAAVAAGGALLLVRSRRRRAA
ncbi:choice-of-anchor Q domain-containing protein [Antiquaquibacter soli]|uniref:Choice-of-anchor Q domain-containing protein n=1 Tax=Antiquaquibacter soli TaxID=3064523 RepID=A0ABT9BTR0_9MICO|nr:choice-of-anchor Q domain-containing protein [Protaetiibacter sp. WY-16]MDO7882747.1 choice-of-anchor Q domain-containing protein [Protaetiibacter sp. WY-16]